MSFTSNFDGAVKKLLLFGRDAHIIAEICKIDVDLQNTRTSAIWMNVLKELMSLREAVILFCFHLHAQAGICMKAMKDAVNTLSAALRNSNELN